jgi:DNA-binding winged helix-turn-helix (wHTH) protein
MLICSADGRCSLVHQYESDRDALPVIEAMGPSGIVLLGEIKPDPIAWVDSIRLSSTLRMVPIAIIGAADEFPSLPGPTHLVTPGISSRLRNLLRADKSPPAGARKIPVDQRARELCINGKRKSFSPSEFRLLSFLMRYPGVVFSRDELNRRISAPGQTNYRRLIDVLVKRIRSKIERSGDGQHHVRTVRGLGYCFDYNGDVFVDTVTRQEFASWRPHVTNL